MNTKWLSVDEGVVLTPSTERVISIIDPYFENELSSVSSALRTTHKQLSLIIEKLKQHGIYKDFPEIALCLGNDASVKIKLDGKEVFYWQPGWSKLLNIGDIINPPIPAVVLCDYVRPGSKENKKGQIIDISNHQKGNSFDIRGGTNILEKAKRVMKAYQSGKCFIKGYLVEHINNAIHVDCVPL